MARRTIFFRPPSKEDGPYAPILEQVARLTGRDGPVLVSIDGRCGSGKSALGAVIAQTAPCNLLHMDHFYLPMERRAKNWKDIPGGNMDFASVLRFVIEPAKAGRPIVYRPYVCQKGGFGREIALPPRPLTVIEGSCCQHPVLREYYGLRIFLTCGPDVQARRLREREGDERFQDFRRVWIPLEERYIQAFQVAQMAHIAADTSDFF